MPAGRPYAFDNAEELQKAIDAYFKSCEESGEPLSITGLCLALDVDRKTLINYVKDKNSDRKEMIKPILMAKLKIEHAYELRLIDKGRSGDIFALKNFDWTDRQEIDNTVSFKEGKLDEILEELKEGE